MREKILRALLKKIPEGDLCQWESTDLYKVSCLFVFYKRIDLMTNILHCLESQEFDPNTIEVVLVEDRGGGIQGQKLVTKFKNLNVSYFAPENNWGKMGYMRNLSLSKAKGEIVLFLDDDTTILDNLFLRKLIAFFEKDPSLMAVLPRGNPSYHLLRNRYGYHDPNFFSNKCIAYRRKCLIDLKGFDNQFIGQEDVELAIRFLRKGYKFLETDSVQYLHPPLVVHNLNKSKAVGFSFARSKYSAAFKLALLLNGSRWIPRIIYPNYKNLQMAKFGFGFLLGFFRGMRKGGELAYV